MKPSTAPPLGMGLVSVALILLTGSAVRGENPDRSDREDRVKIHQVSRIRVRLDEIERRNQALARQESRLDPLSPRPDLMQVPIRGGPLGPEVSPTPSIEPVGEPLAPAPPLDKSFPGMGDDDTVLPPDTMGAAGPAHLVSILNRGVAIFDKDTGDTLFGPVSLQAFWSPLGTGSGEPAAQPFDPKALYDQYSDRFILVSDSGKRTSNSWLLLAVSITSDPTEGFDLFAVDANGSDSSVWADFPGLGVDPRAIYVTNNMFEVSSSPAFTGAKIWIFDKETLLSGGQIQAFEIDEPTGGFTWQPAHAFGPTDRNYVINEGWIDCQGGSPPCPGGDRFLKIQEITFSLAGFPTLTDLGFIQVATYGFDDNSIDAPQSGCAESINTNDFRLLNLVQRNGKLWTTHHVDDSVQDGVGKLEIAWYEIDPTLARINPEPTSVPIQEGRVSDPDLWYYYPSIAVNINESVGLGFSGSSSGTFVGGYYTMRLATDAAGIMSDVALLKGGQSPYFKTFSGSENRWGDYSATVVDPVDDATFWTTQEYAGDEVAPFCPAPDTGRWETWWGSFKDGLCTDADGDGFGLPGHLSCPGGPLEDCDDTDPAISPGAADFCAGADLDCDGIAGNVGADADASGRVDGGDLWEWARRLGTSVLVDPTSIFFQMYDPIVDYDADGDIDGVDLQFLEQDFGSTVCN